MLASLLIIRHPSPGRGFSFRQKKSPAPKRPGKSQTKEEKAILFNYIMKMTCLFGKPCLYNLDKLTEEFKNISKEVVAPTVRSVAFDV